MDFPSDNDNDVDNDDDDEVSSTFQHTHLYIKGCSLISSLLSSYCFHGNIIWIRYTILP